MFKERIILISWISLSTAILLWAIVGLLFWRVNADQTGYVDTSQQAQISAGEMQSAAVAHLAVQRSADEASNAHDALAIDPVQFATLVQSVGPASGATAQISDAVPESLPSQKVTPGIPQLYAFGFVVQIQGSFASVMRALQLLQNLPAPSSIEEVDLARTPADGTQAAYWQMEVRVRLTTTDNISS